MRNFTFQIVTLGCKVNQYESEVIREAWLNVGGSEVSAQDAQFICINSCAVTSNAERESRNAVYRARRNNPNACIILTGCAAKLFKSFKPRKNTFWTLPDRILENKTLLLAHPFVQREDNAPKGFFPPAILSATSHSRPVVKIQDGCGHHCSYCIVPQQRGTSISRSPELVLAEIRGYFYSGHYEVVLSGINLCQYGKERPEYGDFWQLLQFLDNELTPEFGTTRRIRLSSLDPAMLDERALSILGNSLLICPHLHLSIQHVRKDILIKMGRPHYDAEVIKEKIAFLGKVREQFGLGGDFIVGFPGEEENDFIALVQFIEELPFSYAHIFPFSARPGAPATKFTGQIPGKIKQARAKIARAAAEKGKKYFLQKQLALQNIHIARETGQDDFGRGINEYYVPCYFAREEVQQPGLFAAQPIKPFKDGLWVVPTK